MQQRQESQEKKAPDKPVKKESFEVTTQSRPRGEDDLSWNQVMEYQQNQ